MRKKLAHNKREFKTSGGGVNNQVVFTRLEEVVIRLVCLRDCVDGVANTKNFGVPRKRTFTEANIENLVDENSLESLTAEIDESVSLLNDGNEVETADIEIETLTAPRTKGPKTLQLLEKQINIQQKLYDDFALFMKNNDERSEEANANQKKIYRAIDTLCERQKQTNVILQAQLIENKRHNERMEHLALDKNKTKMRILEIELRKAELD